MFSGRSSYLNTKSYSYYHKPYNNGMVVMACAQEEVEEEYYQLPHQVVPLLFYL